MTPAARPRIAPVSSAFGNNRRDRKAPRNRTLNARIYPGRSAEPNGRAGPAG
jgi:hypothetical protein